MSVVVTLQNTAVKPQQSSLLGHKGLLLQRQCACGSPTSSLTGECEECKSKKSLQAKLTIGASNDPLEQEADRVADQVLAAPLNSAVSAVPPRIQRFTGQSTGQMDAAPVSVERTIASSGRPLESALRKDMEQRFGHDFSQVRVHSGGDAEQSAREVHANAYTVGHNVVFGAGRYSPGTYEGRRLIAHELTHVVQQSGLDGVSACQDHEKHGFSFSTDDDRSALARSDGNFIGGRQEAALDRTLQRKESGEIESPELEAISEDLPDLAKASSADPINNSNFIDRRLIAVGVGLSGADFILFCEGIDNPIALPVNYIDLVSTNSVPIDQIIYSGREEALDHVPFGPPAPDTPSKFAYYRAIGGLVVPTTLSLTTAPETVKLIIAARDKLSKFGNEVTDTLVVSVLTFVAFQLARIGIRKWIVNRKGLSLKKLSEAEIEALPKKIPLVYGGSGTNSGTVDLYHYGDLTSVESFESTVSYPKLTNYEFGTLRSEIALRTGTTNRPSLKYKYRIRIDRAHLDKEFGSRDRYPYTEYGTKKSVRIPIKYFEKIGDITPD